MKPRSAGHPGSDRSASSLGVSHPERGVVRTEQVRPNPPVPPANLEGGIAKNQRRTSVRRPRRREALSYRHRVGSQAKEREARMTDALPHGRCPPPGPKSRAQAFVRFGWPVQRQLREPNMYLGAQVRAKPTRCSLPPLQSMRAVGRGLCQPHAQACRAPGRAGQRSPAGGRQGRRSRLHPVTASAGRLAPWGLPAHRAACRRPHPNHPRRRQPLSDLRADAGPWAFRRPRERADRLERP